MDNVTGELRDVNKMALLSGGPGGRGAEQGVHQGLVVSEEGELTTLQEESEETNGGISCQKLPFEGGVFGLDGGKLLGEKSERGPGAMETLLEDRAHMRVTGVNSKGNRSSG